MKLAYDWDWSAAAYELKRAVGLNPRDGLPVQRYATYLQLMGRMDAAIAEGNRALDLEPLSSNHNAQMGRLFYSARQYEQARRQLQESRELDPNYVQTHLYLGWVYEQLGRYEEAIAELQKAFDLSGGRIRNGRRARTCLCGFGKARRGGEGPRYAEGAIEAALHRAV
jgi:tetratricopeptide (TPR) repeat protein